MATKKIVKTPVNGHGENAKVKRFKRDTIPALDFVRVYGPLAKEGKTAYEIGKALGLEGDEKKVAQYVSVKTSQLRKALAETALAKAKENDLDETETENLVKTITDKLPRLRAAGRVRDENVMAEVLEVLNAL